jgi:hypothetical protein
MKSEQDPIRSQQDPIQLPSWLSVLVNILIATLLVGGWIVLFTLGSIRGIRGEGMTTWPWSNEDGQTLLAGIGGLASTVFAIALNLPTDPKPHERVASVLQLVPTKRFLRTPSADSVERVALIVFGILLTISVPVLIVLGAWATFKHPDETPLFISKFSGPGLGILLTALVFWFAKIARRP